VSTLASYAAMSRSAFAARFTQLVGEPPLHYVTRWRLHKAARHLCEKNDSVAQVAALSGYQSEAAFSKVFKQWMGQTPTAFRRAGKENLRQDSLEGYPGKIQRLEQSLYEQYKFPDTPGRAALHTRSAAPAARRGEYAVCDGAR
jgi:AraC-like DNA-binding protein